MNDSKLPVFYHVPKNAGTYVTNMSLLYFRAYRRVKTTWNDLKYETIKNIEVQNDHGTVARLLCGDPENLCVTDKHLTNNPHDNSHHTVNLLDVNKTCINNLFKFQIIIEDAGFHLGKSIIKQIYNTASYQQYITIREPFSRSVSWYSYITSERSSHEPLHQYVTTSFEKYIDSDIFESNWVMRKLVGLPDDQDFTAQHHKQAISELDEFSVYNIVDVDAMIDTMFFNGYEITRNDFPPSATPPGRNQNPIKDKIQFTNLPEEIQKKFTDKTYWDRVLWDKYCTKKC